MNHARTLILVAVFSVLSVALATAQPKPAAPAKPVAAAPAAKPAQAPASATPEKQACNCAGCSGEHAAPGAPATGGANCPMMNGHMQCPMHDAAGLADVHVEVTKAGATIQLIAKNPADVAKVQALARELAEHLTSQKMMHGEMMHGDTMGKHAH